MRRLIRFVARLYPRAWRERYGVEFAVLLEDAELNWRDALDILKGAAKIQMRTWSYGTVVASAALTGAVIAAGISFAMPRQYESSAELTVKAPVNAIKGIAEKTERRTALITVIQKEALYERETAKMPIEDVLQQMMRNIRIMPVASKPNHFAIKYVYEDPAKAQRVTDDLAASFLGAANAAGDFQVLEISSLPAAPVSPNRLAMAGAGMTLGFVLGAIAALAHFIRRRASQKTA